MSWPLPCLQRFASCSGSEGLLRWPLQGKTDIVLARLTSGSVGIYFFAYPRVSNNCTLPAAPSGARRGPFLRRRMQRSTSCFFFLKKGSRRTLPAPTPSTLMDTVAHNASARAPPTPGTPGRVWKSIACMGRLPRILCQRCAESLNSGPLPVL